MILVWLIVVLFAGGILALAAGRVNTSLCRWIALCAVAAGLCMGISVWLNTPAAGTDDSWLISYQADWIPLWGISFHLAMDGLSLLMILLTFFLGILAVLASWTEIRERTGFYYFNLLWILAGICGVFLALDLFLFSFFWELMLIPMYFLIGIWGSENRVYAAYKFFIFTQAGGLLMLLAILGLYFIHGSDTGEYSFNYFDLLGTSVPAGVAGWLMAGFMIAFVIKLPVVPFHTWLPDAHGEAPTAGSLILAGLLLKTGAYGILRFAVPLFPEAAAILAPWAMLLGAIGIIYGAILAYSQTDLKRLVAYTSVSHMGFVILGIFAFQELALQGVVIQLLTHGISTGALFMLAGMLKERLHTRDLDRMGALWTDMPRMGGITLVFVMASLGLPGLGNFIAEFLILLGSFRTNMALTVVASSGLVFSAIYSLRILQRVFLGDRPRSGTNIPDLFWRESVSLAALCLAILWLGIYPQPVLDRSRSFIQTFRERLSPATKAGQEVRPQDVSQHSPVIKESND
jgi:NADH-quinone oxidoreductase subunit M